MGELKSYRSELEDESPDEEEPPRVFCFIFSGLAIGGILRALIKVLNFPIPFRVLILFVGSIVGMLSGPIPQLKEYTEIVHLKPRFILTAFLPLLVFKTAFSIDAHTFMRSWGQIFFLAIPGLLLSAIFTGLIMQVILGHDDWTLAMGILFGTICSPIYPVEIVAMLNKIGQAKHLGILLEGEGMVGDNTVMILVEILLGVIDRHITTWYHVLMVFIRFALGGIALGLVCGKIMTWIMGAMYNDVVNMLISTIVAAYLTYYIGAEILSVSGVIAVVVLGIMASTEKTSLSVDLEVFLLYFWDMLAYVANTMVFLLAGVIIAERLSQYTTLQDYTLVLVTYVVAGVARLIAYIAMVPIVSRIGYGLTFRNMTIAVWSGLRGPVPFCLTLSVFHHIGLSPLGRELLVHIAGLVTLTLLINATTTPLLLRLLGLSELSMARKVNMNNCLRHLQNRRDHTISMLKMDRFLADANWPLVNTATILKHPYKINFSDSDDEEDNYLGYRITTCPDCLKEIPNEPTNKEMIEMTREARMRILKAKKISYARQYENGMLSKDAIRVLTQAVEAAMDTEAALIELEGLHKYFKRQGFVHYTRRRLLAIFFKKSENKVKPPRKYWRRICYHIIMHPAFDIFIYCCIILNVIPIGLEIGLMPRSGSRLSTGLKIANTIFFTIYLMEFILKIYGFSWIYVCQNGFRTYFGSYWNIFDFIILCVAFIDLVMDYVDMFSKEFNKVNHKASRVTLVTKLVRVIRLIRLLRLCRAWYPRLIKYCDSKIDKHLAFAYDIGKGFVTGEEEVSDMLIQMIDNKIIREDCRLRMEGDRLAVTKELGMVQKDRPWIAITVKTRQAIRATLNSMSEAILELKVSGWVDDVEYAMLMESLEERLKYVRTKVTSVQPSPPKVMFKEVPWMADDEQISDFLYENVVTKVFDQGDVVCVDGEMADGVYIIVTGLFKLSYTPRKEILDSLLEYGALPIIDYIASTRFDEKVEDYIVSGNCVGELSALTGRPYNCTITADTASQAYILTHDVIKQAIQRSPDPLNGLESKMWKYLAIRLATSILMDTPAYQSSTQEKIRFQLERAFVPNLTNYKVFGVNEMMEDILLIEGVVFDYNTRDCYTGPCYIPRTVQKIVLPKSSHMDFETTVETKLLIIPARDVDEFDIMEREEEISELVSTASVKCLQHVVQNRSSRLKRKRKRQTTFSMGGRRVKYGESRLSATQSVYYSRSRTTNGSSIETELQNINMYDHASMGGGSNTLDSYVINEKERPSAQDRRVSRGLSTALERRVSSRRASSIATKRPLSDITNKDDGKITDQRFSRVKEQEPDVSNGDEQEELERVSVTEEEKEEKTTSYNRNSVREKKDIPDDLTNSERKQSDDSKKSVKSLKNDNAANKSSPNILQKSEQLSNVEKRKDSNDLKSNEKQQTERSNSLAEKENYRRLSADVKSLNEQDNLKGSNYASGRRPTMTLDNLWQNQRHSSSLRKSGDSDSRKERQTSDEIERIEVEQRSEIFGGAKEDMNYRRKSPTTTSTDKRQRLLDQDDKSERQAGSRKISKDYSQSSEEAKGEDQRNYPKRGSLRRSENTENNNDMKQQRKSDGSERREGQQVTQEPEASFRRKSVVEYPKAESINYKDERKPSDIRRSAEKKSDDQFRSQTLEDQRRRSDESEIIEKQKVTPVAETSYRRKSVVEYPKTERQNKDERKQSDIRRSAEKKSDDQFQSQTLEDQRRRSDESEIVEKQKVTPEAETSYRRKSVVEYPKTERQNYKDERKQSDDRRSAENKSDDQFRSQTLEDQRRRSDESEIIEKQKVTPEAETSYRRKSVVEYPKTERQNYKDERKQSDNRRSAEKKSDDQFQSQTLEDRRRISDQSEIIEKQKVTPEAETSYRRKSVVEYPKTERLNYKDERKQSDIRRSVEKKSDDQFQSQTLEDQRRRSDESEIIEKQKVTPEAETSYRRKSVVEYPKTERQNYKDERKQSDNRRSAEKKSDDQFQSQTLEDRRRISDQSEIIEKQKVTPEAETSYRRKSVVEYPKTERLNYKDERKQSDIRRSVEKKSDDQFQSQTLEDQRRRSDESEIIEKQKVTPEAETSYRRKSVVEYPKTERQNYKDERKQSDIRRSPEKKSDDQLQSQTLEDRRRISDQSEIIEKQKVTPEAETSYRRKSVVEYPKTERLNYKDERKQSDIRRSVEKKSDDQFQSQTLEDQRRRSDESEIIEKQKVTPEAETSYRRKSVVEYPKTERQNYKDERKQSDIRRSPEKKSDDQLQSQTLEDQRRRSDRSETIQKQKLTPEPETSYRRKSVSQYSKADSSSYKDDRVRSDIVPPAETKSNDQSQSQSSDGQPQDDGKFRVQSSLILLRRKSAGTDQKERKISTEATDQTELENLRSQDRKSRKSLIPSFVDKTKEEEFNYEAGQRKKSGGSSTDKKIKEDVTDVSKQSNDSKGFASGSKDGVNETDESSPKKRRSTELEDDEEDNDPSHK